MHGLFTIVWHSLKDCCFFLLTYTVAASDVFNRYNRLIWKDANNYDHWYTHGKTKGRFMKK